MATPQMSGALPPQRKTPIWIWIIVGLLSLIILAVAAVSITSYYVVKKFAENPQAVVDRVIAHNPNIEVVSRDDGAGRITLRDRNSGKTFTIDYEDAKRGRIRFDADGKHVELRTSERGVEVRDGDRTTRVGGGSSRVPAWVPAYPGSSPKVSVQDESGDQLSGTLAFTTADSADKVLAYYGDSLRGSGYNVERADHSLTAADGTGGRSVRVNIAHSILPGSQVAVEFRETLK